MWRRPVLALELAMTTRTPVALDVRHWAHEQQRLLSLPAPKTAPARR
jgi:hypothetical protein